VSTSIHELSDNDLACLRRLVRKLRVPSGHAIIIERGALEAVEGEADGYCFRACRAGDLASHSGGANVVRVDGRIQVFAHATTLRELTEEESNVLLAGRDIPVAFCRWGELLDVIPLSAITPDDNDSSKPEPGEADYVISAESAKRAKPAVRRGRR
jgi:prepilin-type processing-associated H-X9-DG protein